MQIQSMANSEILNFWTSDSTAYWSVNAIIDTMKHAKQYTETEYLVVMPRNAEDLACIYLVENDTIRHDF